MLRDARVHTEKVMTVDTSKRTPRYPSWKEVQLERHGRPKEVVVLQHGDCQIVCPSKAWCVIDCPCSQWPDRISEDAVDAQRVEFEHSTTTNLRHQKTTRTSLTASAARRYETTTPDARSQRRKRRGYKRHVAVYRRCMPVNTGLSMNNRVRKLPCWQ